MPLNKSDLIANVAKTTELKKAQVEQIIATTLDEIKKELGQHGKVTLVGFGTFDVSHRAERKGRSPKTGEEILIPAKIIPKFRPGRELKVTVDPPKPAKPVAKPKKK
jgi:DNA-binding protein HU-beta